MSSSSPWLRRVGRLLVLTPSVVVVLHGTATSAVDAATALTAPEWTACTWPSANNAAVAFDGATECANVSVPLCYDSVCADDDTQLTIAMQRITRSEATAADKTVWMLQSGPGSTPASLNDAMVAMFNQLEGATEVYTMAPRTLPACSVMANTSELLTPTKAVQCANETQAGYGKNVVGFSSASSARDIQTFIEQFQKDSQVFVYGANYGSITLQHLMRSGTPAIAGFVVDAFVPASNASGYLTNADAAFSDVAKKWLELCSMDRTCNFHAAKKNVLAQLINVIQRLDRGNKDQARCADVLFKQYGSQLTMPESVTFTASMALRQVLARMLTHPELRKAIPAVIFRVGRCDRKYTDRTVLKRFLSTLDATTPRMPFFQSWHDVVLGFSELWTEATPDAETLWRQMTNATATYSVALTNLANYCAVSQASNSTACASLKSVLTEYKATTYALPASASLNKTNSSATTLALAASLDPMAPSLFAEKFVATLGARGQVVSFPDASSAVVSSSAAATRSCALSVVASFVRENRKLASVNSTCVKDLAVPIQWTMTAEQQSAWFTVSDAYGGIIKKSAKSNANAHHRRRVTVQWIVTVAFVCVVVALGVWAVGRSCRAHSEKRARQRQSPHKARTVLGSPRAHPSATETSTEEYRANGTPKAGPHAKPASAQAV